MKTEKLRAVLSFVCLAVAMAVVSHPAAAQSRPQKPDPPKGSGKVNQRSAPMTEEERLKAEAEKKRLEEEKNAIVEEGVEKVETNIVSIDVVVYNKKSGQIVTGLKRENFAIFEEGKPQPITSFSNPESPITVSLVVEYSKWSEVFGSAAGGYWEPGAYEVIKPVAYFVSRFIKAPNDYASIIAFDMRPTPITDFTNDPNRLRQSVDLLMRNRPAFRENNLWDALKFTLIGGKGDTVALENSRERTAEYSGMVDLRAPRKAIILVASGIDTFSKVNYDNIRRIIQEAGVPIYVISTGNLFCKKYCDYLDPSRVMPGSIDRMDFLQATNAMNAIAKDSGGGHFPMTFEGEIPDILQTINGLLRSQYNLAYDLTEVHTPGKKYKLQVKVDVDGDGTYDDKTYVVQHRPFYIPAGSSKAKEKSK